MKRRRWKKIEELFNNLKKVQTMTHQMILLKNHNGKGKREERDQGVEKSAEKEVDQDKERKKVIIQERTRKIEDEENLDQEINTKGAKIEGRRKAARRVEEDLHDLRM